MVSNRCQIDLESTKTSLPLNCYLIVYYGVEEVLRDCLGATFISECTRNFAVLSRKCATAVIVFAAHSAHTQLSPFRVVSAD